MLKYKKVVNLTPHQINFITNYNIEIGQDEFGTPEYVTEERIHSIPASGIIARCKVAREEVDSFILKDIDGWDITVPVTFAKFGEVEGLPEAQEGVIYITSQLVAQAVPHRKDVFFPDDIVRDSEGNVVGCRALGKI